MSLNQKRRIFRPSQGILSQLGEGLPRIAVLLAAVGGIASLGAGAWLLVGSPSTPSRTPAGQFLSAPAEHLEVIDGDTLLVGVHPVRLQGIAAPVRGTTCVTMTGVNEDCGTSAANALAALVRTGSVECIVNGHDEAGRPVGDCRTAKDGLSGAMVRNGWARALDGHSELRQIEAEARAAGRGMWHIPRAS